VIGERLPIFRREQFPKEHEDTLTKYDVDFREYWRILKKRKFTIIFIALILGVFSVIFAILKAPTLLYISSCSIKFEKVTTLEGLYARTFTWSSGDDIQTQVSIIKSYSVMERVAREMGLIPENSVGSMNPRAAAIVGTLQSKVEVSRQGYTNIIDIEVTDADPGFTEKLANKIAKVYREVHAEEQNRRTTEALKYIKEQLLKARMQLRESEAEFNQFTQINQLVSIDLQSETLLMKKKEVRDETQKLDDAKAELTDLLVRIEEFVKNPTGSGINLYCTYGDKQYQDANEKLVELLLKRDSLLEEFTMKHPEVLAINRKIVESARKMRLIVQSQINGIEKKERELENQLADLDRKTNELMEKKLEYDRLKRKVDSFHDMVVLLEHKNQEALITKAERPDEVTIVKPAFLPTRAINSPKNAATGALGAIIGLILGMVVAFVAETFDTSLGAIEDVEETLGVQVLGIIPFGDLKGLKENFLEEKDRKGTPSSFKRRVHLISHFARHSMIAESFRSLRTNIQFRDLEHSMKTLAITSASPQEGKTMVATNLAITTAQAGMRTLLVDSDLRKPTIYKIFGIDIAPGLTNILLGNLSWQEAIRTITDIIIGKMDPDEVIITPGLDNLHIITSGSIPPNPAELIDSKRLMDFIADVKSDYDLVIFDTPPILSTADPAILGTKVDGILLVYRVGSISKRLLKRATVQLAQVKTNVIGVALNGMKAEVSPDFYDYKYYKYYYRSHQENDKELETEKEKAKKSFLSFLPRSHLKKPNLSGDRKNHEPSLPLVERASKKSGHSRWLVLILALVFSLFGLLWKNDFVSFGTFFPPDQPVRKEKGNPGTRNEIPYKIKVPIRGAPLQKEKETAALKSSSPETAGKGRVLVPGTMPNFIHIPAPRHEEPAKTADPLREKPEVPSLLVQGVHYPYSVRVGSFKTRARLERAVRSMKEKELSPYWSEVDLGEKGRWFRLFVGYFMTPAEAKAFGEEHAPTGYIVSKTPYAVQIGSSPSLDRLKQKFPAIPEGGHSPYFIQDPEEGHRLLLGAFPSRKAAEQCARTLKETGIDCRAVER